MARPEEADPRWIVEERPDAANVNNWHWTEKNATEWSKNKIKSLLENLIIDESGLGTCKLTEISSIEGEAFANNRKAKLIFFYEWNIKAKWEGNLNGSTAEKTVTGEIEIPNLSEENDPEEIEVQVFVKKGENTVDGDALKELMRHKGTTLIQNKLGDYIRELKQDFAKDLILPTKDAKQGGSVIKHVGKSHVKSNSTKINGLNKDPKDDEVKSQSFKTVKLTDHMKCRAEELFNSFTVPELVSAFTRGNAIVEPHEGGKFSLFDGNINGTFTKLQPHTCIQQKWRFKAWPENHFSDVNITFDEKSDETIITVEQTGVPSSDYERTETGWRTYYFESIKRTFGFGAALY
ncbi:activator of 90 kDa heat shock protein ATPase homolog 1 [Tetranychus urticae]|uniref:Activator of Hsp90 ATPase AHSA1-like N-terminal domain-containing protein n=1 Tax=Tetranychus urticae TaxID=32264 RepID=T1KAF4_TETUR|nr:activator of 90 kDa heat shock protein ATPase homolog 1 [Tetranychus urticae]